MRSVRHGRFRSWRPDCSWDRSPFAAASNFAALLAACLVVLGLTRACGELWPTAPLQSICLHLGVAALLVLGACFRSWLLVLARTICVLVLTALGISAVLRLSEIEAFVPVAIMPWYPLFVIVTGVAYGRWVEQPLFVASAMITLASWGLESSRQSYQQIRRLVSGLDQISAGIFLFVVALAISLRKAGLLPRIEIGSLIRRILEENHEAPAKRWWEAEDVQVSPPAAPDAPLEVSAAPGSGDQLLDDRPVDVGQAEVSARRSGR